LEAYADPQTVAENFPLSLPPLLLPFLQATANSTQASEST
jgi:hypothetical protein